MNRVLVAGRWRKSLLSTHYTALQGFLQANRGFSSSLTVAKQAEEADHGTVQQKTESGKTDKVSTMMFMDANWLENRLLQAYGHKRFGPKLQEKGAVDMGSLVPFIQERIVDAMGDNDGDNTTAGVDTTVCFSNLSRPSNANLDILRALGEQQFLIRNFPVGPNTPVCVPAVAFTADLLHACSLQGSEHIDAAVAMLGSPSFLPALTRAVSANKTVFLATLEEDYKRLLPVMPAPLKERILPLFIDELFPKLLRPIAEWKQSGRSKREIALHLHKYMYDNFGEKAISSVDMADHLLEANLLADIRKYGGSLRKLIVANDDLFEVATPGSGHMYSIKPRPSPDRTNRSKTPEQSAERKQKGKRGDESGNKRTTTVPSQTQDSTSETPPSSAESKTHTISEAVASKAKSVDVTFSKPDVSYSTDYSIESELTVPTEEEGYITDSETPSEYESAEELGSTAIPDPTGAEQEPKEEPPDSEYETNEPHVPSSGEPSEASVSVSTSSGDESALSEDDLDVGRLMELAYAKGLVDSAKVKRDTLFQLLRSSGVSDVKRRLSRKELGAMLAENAAMVAKQVCS
eukprot:gb/GECG01015477.1/.p1 GENE.gb/GECG01015477.1/~~gb/GECG01015477.1/.p1  ORF type:complete len:576 (+),score=95.09 gb/GECG01015477.1/:1-1728(+)